MWACGLSHHSDLVSICTAQLARLLEEPSVVRQPAGLEIKHTCSSLLPSGTFYAKWNHLFINRPWAQWWASSRQWVSGLKKKAKICRGKLIRHYSRWKEGYICQFILASYPLVLLKHHTVKRISGGKISSILKGPQICIWFQWSPASCMA